MSADGPVRRVAGAILVNPRGEVLLHLRDDRPDIPYPNRWAFVGGHLEPGETPEEGVRRELREEIAYVPARLTLFRSYRTPDPFRPGVLERSVFVGRIDLPLAALACNEGQRLGFFRPDALPENVSAVHRAILSELLESPLYAALCAAPPEGG